MLTDTKGPINPSSCSCKRLSDDNKYTTFYKFHMKSGPAPVKGEVHAHERIEIITGPRSCASREGTSRLEIWMFTKSRHHSDENRWQGLFSLQRLCSQVRPCGHNRSFVSRQVTPPGVTTIHVRMVYPTPERHRTYDKTIFEKARASTPHNT